MIARLSAYRAGRATHRARVGGVELLPFPAVCETPPGSGLVFTHLPQDFLDGKVFYGSEALYQQYKVKRGLWRFGLEPTAVPEFLAGYGMSPVEQPTAQEFAARYVAPVGRDLPVSALERSVYAERI